MDDMEHHHGKSANLLSRDGLRSHIMEFQQFAGINVTGELGKKICHALKNSTYAVNAYLLLWGKKTSQYNGSKIIRFIIICLFPF